MEVALDTETQHQVCDAGGRIRVEERERESYTSGHTNEARARSHTHILPTNNAHPPSAIILCVCFGRVTLVSAQELRSA